MPGVAKILSSPLGLGLCAMSSYLTQARTVTFLRREIWCQSSIKIRLLLKEGNGHEGAKIGMNILKTSMISLWKTKYNNWLYYRNGTKIIHRTVVGLDCSFISFARMSSLDPLRICHNTWQHHLCFFFNTVNFGGLVVLLVTETQLEYPSLWITIFYLLIVATLLHISHQPFFMHSKPLR